MPPMDIDEALGHVGGYKRWHMFMFVYVGISCTIPLAGHGLIIVFIGE